jgi:tetratricopeptide (TPR) repeat protein
MPVAIGLFTLAAFFPVLQNSFVDWDDDVNIVDNFNFRGLAWRQLHWMFTNLDLGHYQPLSWLTLGIDYSLWGMNPFGYHLTSLLLHGLNAIVFYFVALRLLSAVFRGTASDELSLRVGAGLAALLFALHPLRVESVAWVTERRGLLAGLFFLLSVLCYLRANGDLEDSPSTRWRWMAGAIIAYGFSLLSKASGLALPLVLVALDVYPLGRLTGGLRNWLDKNYRRIWQEKIPFLALAVAACAIAFIAEHQRGAVRGLHEVSLILRIAQALFGLTFYLWKTLVPAGLFPAYSIVADAVPAYWWFQPNDKATLALSIVIAVGMTILFFLFRRRWPAGLTNWVCYVALLAPVLGFIRFGGHITADRYSYLASLGWTVIAGAGAIHFWRLRTEGRIGARGFALAAALAALVVIGLGDLSWKQARIWRDSDTLFGHVLAVAPRSKVAHINLGFVLAHRGQLDEAVKHFRAALEADPDDPTALFDLGDTLSKQGKIDEAIEQYHHLARVSPRFLLTYEKLGNLLAQKGQLEAAADSYRRAIAGYSNYTVAHNNLGLILASQGKLDEAIEHYLKALDLNPEFALAHVNFGDALVLRGKVDEGIEHLRRALEIEPGLASAHYGLGRALAQKGELAAAAAEYDKGVKKDPGFALAHDALGNAYFQRGQYREAAEQYRQAIKIDPNDAAAYHYLGNALLKLGETDKAIEQYRLATKLNARYAEAYSSLGNALQARGDPQGALAQYRRAVEINPMYAEGHYNLGNALLRERDSENASKHYRRALEINAKYIEARTNLGLALDMEGKKKEAVEQYREVLRVDPKYAPARFNLGLLLGELGQVEGGIEQFREVLRVDPRDVEAHYQLGRFLAAVGKREEAAQEFKEALRIEPRFAPAKKSLDQL